MEQTGSVRIGQNKSKEKKKEKEKAQLPSIKLEVCVKITQGVQSSPQMQQWPHSLE